MTQSLNQLYYSTALDNSVWLLNSATIASGATDPNTGTDAYTLAATANNATISQAITLTGGYRNRVFSIYIQRKTGTGDISISVDGTTFVVKTITGSWVRYDTSLGAEGSVTPTLKIATSGDEVYIAFAQFEDGDTATTYAVNAANPYTITQIVDADYPINTVRGCAFMDGRFFVMNPSGEIYQSALEDASSWSALEFIQSQNDPSNGVFLSKVQNYIVAFKDWSIEFFYDAANATGSILSPVQNATVQIGCASDGSVQDLGGSIAFMGQTRNGFGRAIYMLNGTSPQKISTPNVEKILDQDNLATVHSWSAQVGSHLLYGVTLVTSEVTLVYDMTTQQWSFFTYLSATGTSKTITAITAAGSVTSTSHGFSDGDIIKITATNADFNGWHVVTDVATNTFSIQATGTAFSGSGTAATYAETYFPVVASVRCNGRQYMQDASSGALYELSMDAYADAVGATAARIRTPRFDNGGIQPKFMAGLELLGDKIDSHAVVRYTDDDFQTYSSFRPVDLSANRSRIRRLGNYNRRAFEILHVKDALMRLDALEIDD